MIATDSKAAIRQFQLNLMFRTMDQSTIILNEYLPVAIQFYIRQSICNLRRNLHYLNKMRFNIR